MASPLTHRLARQLRAGAGKYLGIAIMLVATTGVGAGYLSTTMSLDRIMDARDDAYAVEDARLTLTAPLSADQVDSMEDLGWQVVENTSRDVPLTLPAAPGDSSDAPATTGAAAAGRESDEKTEETEEITARLHLPRQDLNLAALHAGRMPTGQQEVALDATFCHRRGLELSDQVELAGVSYTLVGIITLPDYTALFKTNQDPTVNALTFTVGVLSPPGWDRLTGVAGVENTNTYSLRLGADLAGDSAPGTGLDGAGLTNGDGVLTRAEREAVEKETALRLITSGATVTSLIDAEENQGITYATDDFKHDSVFVETLMVVIIVIMSFVFVVITSATIEAESAVIGTLLASGWRRSELLRHYLTLPTVVGVLSAAAGNALGYTLLSAPMRNLYYNTYSLPPFESHFSLRAFLLTTLLPLGLLEGLTLIGLAWAMRRTPLEFLRHEKPQAGILARLRHRTDHGSRLPAGLPFTTRFRLRLLLRGLPSFITLFLGITLSSFLLLAGLALLPVVENFSASLGRALPAEHVYVLSTPVVLADTDTAPAVAEQAEPIATTFLQTERKWEFGPMDVQVLGVDPAGRYLPDLDVPQDQVVLGAGLAAKTGISPGETIVFTDPYSSESYSLTVAGVRGEDTDTRAYMSRSGLNALLERDPQNFNGYFSPAPLSLPEGSVIRAISRSDMDSVAAQAAASFAPVARSLAAVSILVFFIMIYLLTKTTIERGARTISQLKILGYRDREINALYLRTITLTVVASLLASQALIIHTLRWVLEWAFMHYEVNFVLEVPARMLVEEVAIALGVYLLVAALHVLHIRRVPLVTALRVQE